MGMGLVTQETSGQIVHIIDVEFTVRVVERELEWQSELGFDRFPDLSEHFGVILPFLEIRLHFQFH